MRLESIVCFIKVKSYCIIILISRSKFMRKIPKHRFSSGEAKRVIRPESDVCGYEKMGEGLEFLTIFVDIMNEWPFMLHIKIILQKSLVQLQNRLLMSKWILNFLKSIKYLAVTKLQQTKIQFPEKEKRLLCRCQLISKYETDICD